MIDRGQVFVRAKDKTGVWGSADVLDLDDESFRRFVVSKLCNADLVYRLKSTGMMEKGLETKEGISLTEATDATNT